MNIHHYLLENLQYYDIMLKTHSHVSIINIATICVSKEIDNMQYNPKELN
ncbi:hypothetical protein NMY3_01733 [Candidatus Nitrosocosmicus oleophilus]|uniref:Uncharacterized protein n=1 Tax=Candidatus Nitrosocosmicus oleophilus TaxID=1353260 RepID=A0A654LZS2_9ARCH|nr:hypothetical protein NMY3_01733 [Candidatus Nitrosocosmicus oleophilus]